MKKALLTARDSCGTARPDTTDGARRRRILRRRQRWLRIAQRRLRRFQRRFGQHGVQVGRGLAN